MYNFVFSVCTRTRRKFHDKSLYIGMQIGDVIVINHDLKHLQLNYFSLNMAKHFIMKTNDYITLLIIKEHFHPKYYWLKSLNALDANH